MGEIIELLKNMEMQIKELSVIIDCKNGTIASLAKVRDELKEEKVKLKEKLEKIKEIAKECSIHNACISDCAYFEHCDGCVTNLFLQIIEGAEDENN